MNAKQAALKLKVSLGYVYQLCAEGKLEHRRLTETGGIRIEEAEVERFLRGRLEAIEANSKGGKR